MLLGKLFSFTRKNNVFTVPRIEITTKYHNIELVKRYYYINIKIIFTKYLLCTYCMLRKQLNIFIYIIRDVTLNGEHFALQIWYKQTVNRKVWLV